ncbi:MAG: thioredoxin family protein [Polyangiaceae bacterium]|nr:thioredoxin family protein [Polyangiaceae bacterium]
MKLIAKWAGFWGALTTIGCTSANGVEPARGAESVHSTVGEGVHKTGENNGAAPIEFVEDNVEEAAQKAKKEGKALFVDVWAPWCHTCLSMKNYVLGEPALRPLAERVVFASIDSDKPSSAKFMESHKINVWPTFFVIDPEADRVVGAWPGSASLAEMRGFVTDSLAMMDQVRAGKLAEGDPLRMMAEARAVQAGGDAAKAALLFEKAVEKLPADHARRSEALSGWLFALYVAKEYTRCGEIGRVHIGSVKGAAVPADVASIVLSCAEHLEGDAQKTTRAAAVIRLREVTANPSPEASADDRADAWGLLSEALEDSGDAAGARNALEQKLSVLEKAAISAPTPEVAATYDYARAGTYVALGKGGYAVAMLEAREKQMPTSYEPPARLASTLFKLSRYAEAKAAVDRAIERAYGPRKLGYLRLRVSILLKLNDRAGALETARAEVKGWQDLPAGQAGAPALADAKKRLADLENKPDPARVP